MWISLEGEILEQADQDFKIEKHVLKKDINIWSKNIKKEARREGLGISDKLSRMASLEK